MNLSGITRFVKEIKDIELAGDKMIHDLTSALNSTFITPIDREDIHRLGGHLDDVIDSINATAIRFVLFSIEKPSGYANELSSMIVKSSEHIDMAIANLDGKNGSVHSHIVSINNIENMSDKVFHRALFDLFNGEYDAKDVIKLREIYELLETVMDKAEDVSNTIEAIVVKHG